MDVYSSGERGRKRASLHQGQQGRSRKQRPGHAALTIGGHRMVRLVTVLALIVGMVVACGPSGRRSAPTPPPSMTPTATSAIALLRHRLAAFDAPLQRAQAQRAYQDLASAMDAAADAGVNPHKVHQEVLTWELHQFATQAGQQTFQANTRALNGAAVSVSERPQPSAPPLGAGPAGRHSARLAAYSEDQPGSGIAFIFVNGVWNSPPEALEGAEMLGKFLSKRLGYPVTLESVYNASGWKVATYVDAACAQAISSTSDAPAGDLVRSICPLAKGATYFGGTAHTAVTSVQMAAQRLWDPNWASYPVNQDLLARARAALQGTGKTQGKKRVLLITHSQGGLFANNVLKQLTGLPVAALYIAPPLSKEDSPNAGSTRYVMFEHDILLDYGVSGVDPTTKSVTPQAEYDPDNPIKSSAMIHYLANYLTCGSESERQIGDRAKELVDYLNGMPVTRSALRSSHLKSAQASWLGHKVMRPVSDSSLWTCEPPEAPSMESPGSTSPSGSPSAETPSTESPSAGSPPAGSPPAGSPPAGSPPAGSPSLTPPSRSATPIDLSGPWTMEWNWSVTDVYFKGTVSGSGDQYTFQGTVDSGGNAIWTPAKGSLSAGCILRGQPTDQPSPASMNCSVGLPDGTWSGQSQGTLQTVVSTNGQTKFEYVGSGQGTNQHGETSHIDHLNLNPSQ